MSRESVHARHPDQIERLGRGAQEVPALGMDQPDGRSVEDVAGVVLIHARHRIENGGVDVDSRDPGCAHGQRLLHIRATPEPDDKMAAFRDLLEEGGAEVCLAETASVFPSRKFCGKMRNLRNGITVETDQLSSSRDLDPADVIGSVGGHDIQTGDDVPSVILVHDGGIDPFVEREPEALRKIRLEGKPAIDERNRDGQQQAGQSRASA